MKFVQYYLMGFAFLMAGLSAMMFYGEGFATWCWQITTMIWIADSFLKQRMLDRANKIIDNLKNKNNA